MIRIVKAKKNVACNNCGAESMVDGDIFFIQVSRTGEGWTTIMLCSACMELLMDKIRKL